MTGWISKMPRESALWSLRARWIPAGCPYASSRTERSLLQPQVEDVAAGLGLVSAPSLSEYDLIIAGAGPAGLTAAVYTEHLKVSARWRKGDRTGWPGRDHVDDR